VAISNPIEAETYLEFRTNMGVVMKEATAPPYMQCWPPEALCALRQRWLMLADEFQAAYPHAIRSGKSGCPSQDGDSRENMASARPNVCTEAGMRAAT